MKRTGIIILLTTLIISSGYSQNEVDALRYSRTVFGGTARYMGMSGAFGSVGADFSILSTNPAGLGLFKKSEFSFTPAFYNGSTNSEFYGTSRNDSKNNFNMSNVGLVMVNNISEKGKGLRYWQFAFGLNRLQNYNNRMIIEGYNTDNSLVDSYVDLANGIPYFDIEDDLSGYYAYDLNMAWYTYLIDTIPGKVDEYFGALQAGNILQRKDITSWGSMNEMVFSVGANISDRVYLGSTIGFPFIRYFEESTYIEEDTENNHEGFSRLVRYDELKTT
ncbi:MAG: hypothetical protein K8R53_07660, partial [Bacteroidales bacterium]|nr:hypothetical protein [Bacteroidales bacterium]